MSSLWQDIRVAVRGYAKEPLFTVVVLAVLGLGMGANSAIFSFVYGVLLRPLDYPHASELLDVSQRNAETGQRQLVSPPNYFDLREQTQTSVTLAAYWTPNVTITETGGNPEKVLAATCSSSIFEVAGVGPIAGRAFLADDDVAGARRVAVIGHGLWQRRFGADPAAIGRELTLDGVPTLIVGVMPPTFAFPVAGTELWLPLRLSRTQPPNPAITPGAYRGYNILSIVGRLEPGVTTEQARAEFATVGARLARAYPDTNRHTELSVESLQDAIVGTNPTGAAAVARRRRVRIADCVREHCKPPARARDQTIAGDHDPDGTGRRPRAARASDVHREPGPRAGRRWNRSGRQRVAARRVVARGAARDSAAGTGTH